METFSSLMNLLSTGITAYGMYELAFGFVTLASGIKEKTGPEIARGAGGCIAGVLIMAAAYVVTQISIG